VACTGQLVFLEPGYLSQCSDYATGWTSEVRFPAPPLPDRLHLPTASYLMGTSFFSLGIKRPERGVDHSPPCSAKVKE